MTSPTELLASETWNTELTARPKAEIDWVWPGYLAHGAVTLLTSQAKTGKTTLISALIAKMARGGELAGLTVRPARVAVVSEESLDYGSAAARSSASATSSASSAGRLQASRAWRPGRRWSTGWPSSAGSAASTW